MSREDIIRMAREAGYTKWFGTHSDGTNEFRSATFNADQLERFASLVAAAKKEECANACEGDFDSEMKSYGRYFSAAIRALK